jgi:hypothetical protein
VLTEGALNCCSFLTSAVHFPETNHCGIGFAGLRGSRFFYLV